MHWLDVRRLADHVQMYLAADAAVNKKSASGETALHYAFDPCKHMPNTPSLATALRRRGTCARLAQWRRKPVAQTAPAIVAALV
ncbi:hypothetical protein EON66_02670 [archaeon]|nr:MAG: hypothetical protein EON66_02670 [archaeon]